MKRVAIALGSNLGDRHAAMAFASGRIARLISNSTLSEIIETEPVGTGLEGQPLYLNAVIVGETSLGARQLLELLLEIERDFGRERPSPGAARTLDLDLILMGEDVVREGDFELPHPRFRERFFVLGPLAEVAPDMVDPVTGLRAAQLLKRLLRDESF